MRAACAALTVILVGCGGSSVPVEPSAPSPVPSTPAPPLAPAVVTLQAFDDSYTTPAGQILTVPAPGLLENDSIPAGSTPSVRFVQPLPNGAAFTNTGAGGFILDPRSLTDAIKFQYTISSGDISSTANVTVTISPPPAPASGTPQVTFNFGPGVSEADQDAIRAGTDLTLAYFQRVFHWEPTRDIAVNVVTAGGTSSGTASATSITINTGGLAWISRGSVAFHQETVAHELFHLLQLNIGWNGPVWFTEGSAEFIGWQVAIIEPRVLNLGEARSCQIAGVVVFSSYPVPPLAELEDNGFYTINSMSSNTYSAGWMATDELTKPHPFSVLMDFGRNTGDWRMRFQSTFGASVPDFYTRFEALRATWPRTVPTGNCG